MRYREYQITLFVKLIFKFSTSKHFEEASYLWTSVDLVLENPLPRWIWPHNVMAVGGDVKPCLYAFLWTWIYQSSLCPLSEYACHILKDVCHCIPAAYSALLEWKKHQMQLALVPQALHLSNKITHKIRRIHCPSEIATNQ